MASRPKRQMAPLSGSIKRAVVTQAPDPIGTSIPERKTGGGTAALVRVVATTVAPSSSPKQGDQSLGFVSVENKTQKRKRAKHSRKEKTLCPCGRNKPWGRRLCRLCKQKAINKKKLDHRLAHRLPCPQCGRDKGAGPGKQVCSACSRANRNRQPCVRCGAAKPPGNGRQLCEKCAPVPEVDNRRPNAGKCISCGSPKPAGRGRRLCVNCLPVGGPRPCIQCGSREPKSGHGRHLCDDCHDIVLETSAIRRRAVAALKRKPCRGCGRPKGDGRSRQYCDRCRKVRDMAAPCVRCEERPRRYPSARLCVECHLIAQREAQEKSNARQRKRRRNDPVFAARERKRARESNARRYKRTASDKRRNGKGGKGMILPGKPLAAAVRWRARQETAGNLWDDLPEVPYRGAFINVCRRAGVTDRAVRRWEEGEHASFSAADQICTHLSLNWWEIWAQPQERSGHGRPREVSDYIERCQEWLVVREIFEGPK